MPQTTKTQSTSSEGKLTGAKEIAEWVRQRIRMGRFVPGQRLVEADIIKATGAGRSKVREALQRLESEGLVVIEEFRGASVKNVTWEQVQQIYRTRAVLEGLAAAEFAAADASEAKKTLQKLQDELNTVDSTGDHERFAQLNSAWHGLIIEASGNEYVRQFLTQLTVPIHRLLFSSFYNAKRVDSANADHRVVTAAIVDGRIDDAERAMRDHIGHGLQAISEIQSHLYS